MRIEHIKIRDTDKVYSANIGRKGEYGSTIVEIDASELDCGTRSAVVSFVGPGQSEIIVPTTQRGSIIYWTVNSDATLKAGIGEAWVRWHAPGELTKSAKILCDIKDGGSGTGDTAQDYADFIARADALMDELIAAGADAASIQLAIQNYFATHPDMIVTDADIITSLQAYWNSHKTELKGDAFTYSDFTAAQLEGLRGPQGLPGTKGDPGYTPQKGIDYFDGEPGYTPQKGIDYFDGERGPQGPAYTLTTVDKYNIKEAVLKEITIPKKLPNPYSLTINGVAYDGSAAKTLNVYTKAEIDAMFAALSN